MGVNFRICCSVFTLILGGALAACASDAAADDAEPPAATSQWMVRLAGPDRNLSAEDVVRLASRSAGVPVTYVASVSSRWHSIALRCGTESRCEEAVRRLKADTGTFDAVESDAPKRIPVSP